MNKTISMATALAGVCTIALGIIMVFVFPMKADLPQGFKTPIIAFEFAKNEADLSYLSGQGEVEKANREKMDAGHQWDLLFPFAYGGFIALLLFQLVLRGHPIAWLGLPIAILIIPFDINENLTLLSITDALSNAGSVEVLLSRLQIATWLKWGAIGAAVAVLGAGYVRSNQYWSAAVCAIASLSVAICRVSNAKPVIAESMSMAVFVFFLFFSIKAGIHAWKTVRQNT